MDADKKKKFEINTYLDDLLVIAGCGLILVGVYKFIPVATWFVGGIMLILAGIMIGTWNRKTK